MAHLLDREARETIDESRMLGVVDQNPLRGAVLKQVPKMQHRLQEPVNFDDRIELLGYTLRLPGKDFVGPGQKFEVDWVFRAKRRNIGNHKVFLHVDGSGNRVNGDHDPVDGKYPVRLWDEGDIVVDHQMVSIPASFRAGSYQLLVGFFRGDDRLKVKSGRHDGTNRAKAGRITVR